ncbi:MAG: ATP-binding cassette domain-containing protein [Gammaproteobacteria bacterium]|nr:ATP-binding cassette domain-containing protein [Gammaproteobacteria bacterium]
MLQFKDLSLRRGHRLLFEHASFQVHPGQKIGISGANGSGKSSLFALILDQLHADSGDYCYPKDWVVAHVAQEMATQQSRAIEYVLDGDAELRQIESALVRAEADDDGLQVATLHGNYDSIGGYSARSRAGQLMNGLGFSRDDGDRDITEFSGGWRMRLNLARALMCRSDLLLLDEPTNHLDLDAVIWLESWLHAYPGTLLLVSHDRDFLDSVADHIAHIEQQVIRLYPGNYSAFERIRAERLANQQAAYEKQQREIAHMRSFVDRFRAKATKARQAQSRLKALQRMQTIAPAHVDSPFHFSLGEPEKRPQTLLQLHHADVGYGDNTIICGVELNILAGDRIGLLGRNGAGKSTLIKLLAGAFLDGLRLQQGERNVHKDAQIGYFAQHQVEQLHPEHTPLEHLQQLDHNAREADLRNHLGGFGFASERALAPVGPFSGGEKSRLVLAMLVYQRPNLLLLDEPTNHLDLEMRQALAVALQDFSGAMLIVSHDRHLLRVTCDQLMLVHDEQVDEFPLSLDEYPRWLNEQNQQAAVNFSDTKKTGGSAKNAEARKDQKRVEAEQRQRTQPVRKRVTEAETKLEALQLSRAELVKLLADPALYSEENKRKLQDCLLEKAKIEKQCDELESEWLLASEELEALL